MNTYIPEMKALWMAENVIASLHNIYTLRGAQVRDPLRWSKYINETLYLFGSEADVMFASIIGRVGARSVCRRCCVTSATSTLT